MTTQTDTLDLARRDDAWRHCKACNSQRRAETCWKCGGPTKAVDSGWEYPEEPDIERIRELAKEVGYAVGFHGSRERDLDLIAAPWAEGAVGPYELAKHIADGLGGEVVDYKNQDKPHGRWSCNIHTPDWTKLIDLSVCPIAALDASAEIERLRDALRPFAAYAEHYPLGKNKATRPGSGPLMAVSTGGLDDAELTVEDFHQARTALKES